MLIEIPWHKFEGKGTLELLDIAIRKTPSELASILNGKTLVIIPERIRERAEWFLKSCPDLDVIDLDDLLDPRLRDAHQSPLVVAQHVLSDMEGDRRAVLLEYGPSVCGFLPALLTILVDRERHVEKVIFPVRQMGYELFPDQAGYLRGLGDGIHFGGGTRD